MGIIGEQGFSEPKSTGGDIGELSFIYQSISRSVSQELIKYMKLRELSKSDMCRIAHIGPDKCEEWLSGKYNFTIKELSSIQYYFGVKVISINQKTE